MQKLYIQDPAGNIVCPIHGKSWVRFPDGDHVSNPQEGFTSTGGFTVIAKEEVTQLKQERLLPRDRIRRKGADSFALLGVLYRRGFLEGVRNSARLAGGMTEVFFERAPLWTREGQHEVFLLGSIKVQGKSLTTEEIDSIFLEAVGEA